MLHLSSVSLNIFLAVNSTNSHECTVPQVMLFPCAQSCSSSVIVSCEQSFAAVLRNVLSMLEASSELTKHFLYSVGVLSTRNLTINIVATNMSTTTIANPSISIWALFILIGFLWLKCRTRASWLRDCIMILAH